MVEQERMAVQNFPSCLGFIEFEPEAGWWKSLNILIIWVRWKPVTQVMLLCFFRIYLES